MASKLETNFNTPPYYNTYDEEDNYHRVLFKPGVALQSRELLELQDILQDQVGLHGNHVFKDGSIVRGCAFTLDDRTPYAKFPDLNSNGQELNISELTVGNVVMFEATSGVAALVVDGVEGLESQNPDLKTLYFKYIAGSAKPNSSKDRFDYEDTIYFINRSANSFTITIPGGTAGVNALASGISVRQATTGATGSVTVANSSVITISNITGYFANGYNLTFSNNSTSNIATISTYSVADNYLLEVAPIASWTTFGDTNDINKDTIGKAARVIVTDGVIFQKGHFVRVDAQSVIAEKYRQRIIDSHIGFYTQEAIVNSSADSTLLDTASGASNENAPGADRLQLSPTLVTLNAASAAANSQFLPLVVYKNGFEQEFKGGTQYNQLAEEFAKRTYEESGDYIVNDFTFTTNSYSSNTEQINRVVMGPGVAYVRGHRVESREARFGVIRKATDTANAVNQSIFTNYQGAVYLNEVMGNFEFTAGDQISLWDTAHDFLSGDTDYSDGISTATLSGNVVGTARIRSVEKVENVLGTPTGVIKVNVFDVRMNEGQQIKNTLGVSQGTSGSYNAVGNVVKDNSGNVIRGDLSAGLVFDTGVKGVKTINAASLVARSNTTLTIGSAADEGGFSLPSGEIFPYSGDPTPNRNDFLITPRSSFFTGTLTGSANVESGNTTITGNGTDFTGELVEGQYVYLALGSPEYVRVDQINSATEIVVDPAPGSTANTVTTRYGFPADVTLDLEEFSGQLTTAVTNSSATFTLSLDSTISGATTFDVVFNRQINEAEIGSKILPTGADDTRWVHMDITATADKTGPWSLGITDAFEIVKVYGTTTAPASITDITTQGTDITNRFELDSGQTKDYYGYSRLIKKRSTQIDLSSYDYLVVQFKYFIIQTAGDYFAVGSYPTSNTVPTPVGSISTQKIPVFTNIYGREFDLRNCVDFRPSVTHKVTPAANVESSPSVSTVSASNTIPVFGAGDQNFPTPNDRFDYNIEYFLPRKDLITLEPNGGLAVLEGRPDLDPKPPANNLNTLTIAKVDVPVFPSLDAITAKTDDRLDYLMKVTSIKNRRYTMEDLAQLDARVKSLEYESALNTLERKAKDTVIPSEANNAVERFKTSIDVDGFDDLRKTDVNNPESRTIPGKPVRSSISPPLTNFPVTLVANTSTSVTNNVSLGNIITIDYTNVEWISQPYASQSRALLQDEFNGDGIIDVFPAYDNYYDSKTSAVNVGEVGVELPPQSRIQFGTDDQADYLNQSVAEYTKLLGDDEVRITAQQLAVGDFVRDPRLTPYLRTREILLRGVGLKPGNYHRVYMDNKDVTEHCVPVTMAGATEGKYINKDTQATYLTDDWRKNADQFYARGTRGTFQSTFTLTSGSTRPAGFKADVDGTVLVALLIPEQEFFVGNHRVAISDASTYNNISVATSTCFGDYNAYNYALFEGMVPPKTYRGSGSNSHDGGGNGSDRPGTVIGRGDPASFPTNADGSFRGFDDSPDGNPDTEDWGGISHPQTTAELDADSRDNGTPKIICSALYRLGHMPYAIYEVDQMYGRQLHQEQPEVNEGYRKWAQVVVDWMDGKGPSFMPWIQDDQVRAKKQSELTIKVAKRIATPWAIQMAYEMGTLEKGSFTGKLLMTLGYPISKLVHKSKRKATQFDYYLLAGFCMALYGISSILKPFEGIKDFDDLSEEDLMNAERKLKSL